MSESNTKAQATNEELENKKAFFEGEELNDSDLEKISSGKSVSIGRGGYGFRGFGYGFRGFGRY